MPPLYRLIRNSFHNQVTISILDSSTPAKFPNHSSGLLHSPNMRVSQILVGALAAVPSFASPLVKREHINDFVILNYALTLVCINRIFMPLELVQLTHDCRNSWSASSTRNVLRSSARRTSTLPASTARSITISRRSIPMSVSTSISS